MNTSEEISRNKNMQRMRGELAIKAQRALNQRRRLDISSCLKRFIDWEQYVAEEFEKYRKLLGVIEGLQRLPPLGRE